MNLTKKTKRIGITVLAVTLFASMSTMAFAVSTSSKVEIAKKSEIATTENLDNVDLSKIKYELAKESEIATTENLSTIFENVPK